MKTEGSQNRRSHAVTRVKSHSFLAGLLPAEAIVVDLGANCGMFSDEVNCRFGWKCVAVEPNPDMFHRIPQREGIVAINAAVTVSDGPVTLNLADNPESSSLLALPAEAAIGQISVPGMTLSTLRAAAGVERIDLLKMDIEGAEIGLLSDVNDEELTSIRQITIEFHESMGLSSLDEVREAIKRLQRVGFTPIKMSMTHYGDVLFVNNRLCGTGTLSLATLKYLTRSLIWTRRAWERATAR